MEFFDQVQLHRELGNLALKRSDLGFVLRDDRSFCLFDVELTPAVLRQPQLNQIGRQGVLPGRITAPDGVAADVLAQLDLELRRVAPVRTSR